MKRIIVFVLVLSLTSALAVAQEAVEAQQTEAQPQSIGEEILKEIKQIREIQQIEMLERDSIAKGWQQHRHDQAAIDSLSNNPNQLSAMLQIENNTHQDWTKDDWNLFGWVTFAIAFLSLIVGGITYWAQMKTEKHTTNAPIAVQLWTLRDLPRHFYRNLVCTCAIILKYRAEGPEKMRASYPSESNLRKLQTLPDDIVLPIDIDDTKKTERTPYFFMHELRLLLRNYNIEVEVASEHLSRPHISDASLREDFDNLLFKPIQLTHKTFDFEKSLVKKSKESLAYRAMLSMMAEHFKKLKVASNFKLLYKDAASARLSELMMDVQTQFKAKIDDKEGVDRSVDNLLEYGSGEKAKANGLKIVSLSEKKYEARLTRKAVTAAISKKIGKDSKDYLQRLTTVGSAADFVAFYQAEYNDGKPLDGDLQDKLTVLYRLIKPYLDYLRQDTWEFHTLLKYMLAVDAAIETDRIGMVNFS